MYDEELFACPQTVEFAYVCAVNLMQNDGIVAVQYYNAVHEIRLGATRSELIRRILDEIKNLWCDQNPAFPRSEIQARYTFLYLEKNTIE